MRTVFEFKSNEAEAMMSMIASIADEMGEKAQAKIAEYSMKLLSGCFEFSEEPTYITKEMSVFATEDGFMIVLDLNDEVISDIFRFFRRGVRIARPIIDAGKAIAKVIPGISKELNEAYDDILKKHTIAARKEQKHFDMKFGVYNNSPYVIVFDAKSKEIEDIFVKFEGDVFSVGAYDEENEELHKIFLHCIDFEGSEDVAEKYSKEEVVRLANDYFRK